jgi:hypothetical protein
MPITYEDVARDAASRVVDKFRKSRVGAHALDPADTSALRDLIRQEVLATLGDFGRASSAQSEVVDIREARIKGAAIAPGDVVRLRSGGPLMSVGQIFKANEASRHLGQAEDAAHVVWIDEAGQAATATIGTPALERVSDKLPALYDAAVALWGPLAKLDANEPAWDHPFDYYQNDEGTERIRALGKALRHIDGVARSFEPKEQR